MHSALSVAHAGQPHWSDDAVIAGVKAVATGPLAQNASRIDAEGYYPLDIMGSLGEAGALGVHLERHGARAGLSIDSMSEASRACGATGFLMWCHDVCGLYMEQSGNPHLSGARLDAHARGAAFGGTALSNPMKALSGIEPMMLRARPVPGGYLVNGTLPWVSHIGPGQYCGAMASVLRDDGSSSHELMFLLDCDERVQLKHCPVFSGMEGTSTWSIRLTDYFVGEDTIIADPAKPLIARIRPLFILLQVGMALGVAQGGIDSSLEVEPLLGHVNRFLHDRPDELAAELDEAREQAARLARTPYDGSKDYLLDVLDLRARGAELALRAAQASLLHQGARGYLMGAAPQRRIRESHFVAIVTPAIKHLRWEMARLGAEELPA
ncbi:acyl-CoA dehydrogenase [Paraburkholderia sp. UCT31]|uniref:acyl-CoA dehydrogenase family protein n=1 Tax=Paraburkholderia sp. UCT31 TaxID=2615209 RepID=UPI001654CFAC|nr:acyl-CoA dehydrogenase family protein [Paraburkholderia sp. UCT31]MBC8740326.1 acyl-CoA dehydrogenase [Paraburkholderia sp. UCT31]